MVSSTAMSASPESVEYCRTTTRNVSLSRAGRRLFLALIFLNTGILALAWAVAGAWPILPFAGLELGLLAYAFHYVGKCDGDFERLTIDGAMLTVETCERGVASKQSFNRAWVRLRFSEQRDRCHLALQYRGNEYKLGKLMNDEQRSAWGRELRKQIRIVST